MRSDFYFKNFPDFSSIHAKFRHAFRTNSFAALQFDFAGSTQVMHIGRRAKNDVQTIWGALTSATAISGRFITAKALPMHDLDSLFCSRYSCSTCSGFHFLVLNSWRDYLGDWWFCAQDKMWEAWPYLFWSIASRHDDPNEKVHTHVLTSFRWLWLVSHFLSWSTWQVDT